MNWEKVIRNLKRGNDVKMIAWSKSHYLHMITLEQGKLKCDIIIEVNYSTSELKVFIPTVKQMNSKDWVLRED